MVQVCTSMYCISRKEACCGQGGQVEYHSAHSSSPTPLDPATHPRTMRTVCICRPARPGPSSSVPLVSSFLGSSISAHTSIYQHSCARARRHTARQISSYGSRICLPCFPSVQEYINIYTGAVYAYLVRCITPDLPLHVHMYICTYYVRGTSHEVRVTPIGARS